MGKCNECKGEVSGCIDSKFSKCLCPIKLNSSCVLYDGKSLGNLEVHNGEDLTSIIIKINDLIQQSGLGELINVGDGAEVYKGVNLNNQSEIRTIVSNDGSLTITIDGDTINIEAAAVEYTDVPRYIVNNLYTGLVEEGTYTRPYKTIQAALTKFQGSGTINSPERSGATIIVQKGNTYNLQESLTYRDLNLVIEEGAVINHQPPIGEWLVDYNMLDNTKATFSLEVKRGAVIRMFQKGFRNRGSLGGAAQAKVIRLTGAGTLTIEGSMQTGYTMFDANSLDEIGYSMPAQQNFLVEGLSLTSALKDIWNVGINAQLIFNNCTIRHSHKGNTINPNSKSFNQTGGGVTLNSCDLSINGGSRVKCFTLYKGASNTCRLTLDKCRLTYPDTIENIFFRESEGNPRVECQYMSTTENLPITYVFGIYGKLPWVNINFSYNIIKGGALCELTSGFTPLADLTNNNTTSVHNSINGVEVSTLTRQNNKIDAKNNLGVGVLFINTEDIFNPQLDITM